jgi:hypothetical protein
LTTQVALALPLTLASLGLMYVVFQTAYPQPDGDTTKSPYLLDAVAPVSVAAAWSLSWFASRNRAVGVASALVLACLLVLDLHFLVL